MTKNRHALMLFAGLTLAAGAAYAQRVEETNTALAFSGGWTPTTDMNASGGAYTVSSSVGSAVSFSVTGNSFVLYRKVDANGGYADVKVDGQSFGSITFYLADTRWQVPALIDQLGNGQHTIVLTVSQTQPTGSGGTNVYFDALENPVPAGLLPTQPQLDAVTRTNFYRNLMGIPPVVHHLAIGMGADAHAKYLNDVDFVSNGTSPHVEVRGASPFFSGEQPSDRAALFGFTGNGVGEDSNNSPDPVTFVDGWMDGVYHREPFLSYSSTYIGFGGALKGSAMDFGSAVNQPVSPTAITISTFPADKQTDVWLTYDGSDGPTNVMRGGSYGFPISLFVSFPANAVLGAAAQVPTVGTLTDAAGKNIPVTIADGSTDNQLGTFFMIPNQPLTVSTTYTARMTGTDTLMNSFDKTWKFTTANPASIHRLRAALGNTTYVYSINWDMPGSMVPSQLEYGPTTAYGSVIPGNLFPGRLTTFRALVPGLFTVPATHYRVTAKDSQGNTYTTPDHVITVAKTVSAATVGFVTLNSNPGDTSMQWETAGPVTSTQVKYGPDTNYGMTQQARLFDSYSTYFYLDLNGLTPGATYHYQIVTTDLQGNTVTTPDATFVSQ